jgi:hypothetical protein
LLLNATCILKYVGRSIYNASYFIMLTYNV